LKCSDDFVARSFERGFRAFIAGAEFKVGRLRQRAGTGKEERISLSQREAHQNIRLAHDAPAFVFAAASMAALYFSRFFFVSLTTSHGGPLKLTGFLFESVR